ncbi:MAG: TrmH family RNA methyltransferase [Planctomycetota bacterium]
MSEESVYLVGALAVEAVLRGGQRAVRGVFVDEGLDWRKVEPVRRAAKEIGLEIQWVGRVALDEMVGDGKHGGVVAAVGPRRFRTLEELLAGTGSERTFLVMLDGVEDPYNFGQALRSLWAAGCHGVVVRPRNWSAPGSGAEAVVARASAGASEWMPMAIAETPEVAVEYFRGRNVRCLAMTEGEEAVAIDEAGLGGAVFVVVGGEKRGIKRGVLELVEGCVAVPYGRAFGASLGTVAAVSVLGFEVRRQREVVGGRR